MRLLVTGAQGFIGRHVVRLLELGGHEAMSFAGDVRHPAGDSATSFEAVIHLASLISHRGAHSRAELRAVNIEGTRQMLARHSSAHFVYASTTDVERESLSEYAQSKLEAEHLVVQHPSHCIVRLPSVFGPGQRQESKLIPRLLCHYLFGEPVSLVTNEARPYLYVEAAAVAICSGLRQRGLVSVPGMIIHNRELENLVAIAVRGDTEENVPIAHQQMLLQLRECADALRRSQTPHRIQPGP